MKYLFVGKEFGLLKRGGFTITKRFCEHFSDLAEFIPSDELTSLDKVKDYKKIIFRTQVPSAYKVHVNGVSLRNINHLVYIRQEHNNSLFNSCTNGFHYFKQFKSIKNYIPLITPFSVEKVKRERPCLGFYERNFITKDSFDWFVNMVKELQTDVDLYFMGNTTILNFISMSKHVKSVTHTFDNKEFYANVTHYVYPKSKMWVDPFPHSMLEGIQTDCQIICPTISGRDHMDGVDDILDCIEYHTTFNPDVYFDNSKTVLNWKYFAKFYEKAFENDFEYQFDRNKYTKFNEWIEREIM